MDVVYSWAVGKTFVECLAKTDLFEGSVIRAIRRLHELLANLCLAAKAVGDPELDALFEAAGDALRRGIVRGSGDHAPENPQPRRRAGAPPLRSALGLAVAAPLQDRRRPRVARGRAALRGCCDANKWS